MSPPKVNLAGKEPLQDNVSDEALPGKSDSLAFPAVITLETDRRAQIHRRECQRQRARRVICGAAMVIVVAVAALGTMALVHRLRRHHRKYWTCNTGPMPHHVKVDHDNKLIRVDHDHDENSKTNAMQILHEYNRKMVAYKDVDQKICYIDRLDETFEDGYERWQTYEKKAIVDKKVLKVISEPIEIDVIRHVMDIHITEHCTDSKSVWVMEIEERQVTTEMEVKKQIVRL